ncbi:hypothetical protein NMG60_11036900 [Bertholletia excelsa]
MASPLHEIILLSFPDRVITVYDALSATKLTRFTGSQSPRKGLLVVGNNLIAASRVSPDIPAGSIHLYNWRSSTALRPLPVTEPVGPLVATSDGLYIFAGGFSGHIHIHTLSLSSARVVRSFRVHLKPISCLAIDRDGSILFSGIDDGSIAVFAIFKLLDISSSDSNLVLHQFLGHEATVTSISNGASNFTLISCSLDCTCKFWSLSSGTPLQTVAIPSPVWGLEVEPLGSEFYVAGSDGWLYSGML